jgi:protein phosphatase
VNFEAGVATDPGRQRSHNEDAVLVSQADSGGPALLAAIADGIGGLWGGEVASQLAVQLLGTYLTNQAISSSRNVLLRMYDAVNLAIWELATSQQRRMGTTLVSCLVLGDRATVANVGDSRAYLWSGGDLQRLTADHNAGAEQVLAGTMTVAQLKASPIRRFVTRSLGTQADTPETDIVCLGVAPCDQIVLCSDGLYGVITDGQIADSLAAATAQAACDDMVRAANRAGGPDNISVIVLKALPAR